MTKSTTNAFTAKPDVSGIVKQLNNDNSKVKGGKVASKNSDGNALIAYEKYLTQKRNKR